MATDQAPAWTKSVMRAGYGARAVVYTILGGLTVASAFYGNDTEGTREALATLKGSTFGQLLLWIIALGLFCYSAWRFLAAYFDLENRGDDSEGLFKRAALVVTGLLHAALGVSVAALTMGGSSGGDTAGDWTAKILTLPMGRWIVGIIAVAVVGAGAHYLLKGIQRKYEQHIRVTSTTRKLDPALRFGFIAYGIVLAIVGVFLIAAALNSDPSQAKGIGDALSYVRNLNGGTLLLGALGIGLLSFALENAVEAFYRVIPRLQGDDEKTLYDAAKEQADKATD